MHAIDKNLLANEIIICRNFQHPIVFFPSFVMACLSVACLFSTNPVIAKLAFFPSLLSLGSWLTTWVNYKAAEFIITNKRIVLKEGFLIKHMQEARLHTISSIATSQSILGQLLNYGNLTVNTFGGQSELFSTIAKPLAFKKHLQAQLDSQT